MKHLLFCVLFLPFTLGATSVKHYIITTGKDTVGNLTVKSWIAGDTVVYEYSSEASVKFFGHHHVISKKTCKYVGDRMVSAISTHYENGSLRDTVSMFWRNGGYDVHENGDDERQTDVVSFGTIKMFFGEPQGEKAVFAEVKLQFQELTCTAKGCYRANAGWGKKNMYYYDNSGELVKAEINSPLIDFELHLVRS